MSDTTRSFKVSTMNRLDETLVLADRVVVAESAGQALDHIAPNPVKGAIFRVEVLGDVEIVDVL